MTLDVSALVSRSIHIATVTQPVKRSRAWRPDELNFLIGNLGRMSEFEISQHLPGRSKNAVHIMRERRRLPAATKSPGWKSASKWSKLLGLKDQRPVSYWVRQGLVDGYVSEAAGGRQICMIQEASMRAFVLNPRNWVYFDPMSVQDAELKRMLEKQAKRWGDEWLSNRQAADLLASKWGRPVNSKDILRYINQGRLDAQHVVNKDGRQHVNDVPAWSFWMVRRSQVEALRYYGSGDAVSSWTEAADAFLVLARAVGLSDLRIEKLTGKHHSLIGQRWAKLQSSGKIEALAKQWGSGVVAKGGAVTADWRQFRERFPRIEKAAQRYLHGTSTADDRILLSTILRAQAIAHGKDPGVKQKGSAKCVGKIAHALLEQGLQPYL